MDTLSPTSPVEAEVLRIRGLLEARRFAEALAAAQTLLRQVPENRDVLYMIAVSQRYLKRIGDALATLSELQRLHPAYPRLYQERGHCHVALRSADPAIEAFEHAVKLSPCLPASWRALEALYRIQGCTTDAGKAALRLTATRNASIAPAGSPAAIKQCPRS